MIRTPLFATVAALAAALATPAVLEQASAPVSRADVKAETRAAEKAGKLAPAGQGGGPVTSPATRGPSTTRAERKAATLKARKDGELEPPGPSRKGDLAAQKQASTKTRDERKAETLEAKKKGELAPAGEAQRK